MSLLFYAPTPDQLERLLAFFDEQTTEPDYQRYCNITFGTGRQPVEYSDFCMALYQAKQEYREKWAAKPPAKKPKKAR